MIDVYHRRAHTTRYLWSRAIRQLFKTLELQDHRMASNISESLAVFCQENSQIPGRSLSLLIAHAFCVVSDFEMAERVLRHDPSYRLHTDSWLTALTVSYPFQDLYPLFSARILRPQVLHSVGETWVLDFDAISISANEHYELSLFQAVRLLTEKVSNVWQTSDGQKTLGIKGLDRLSYVIRPRDGQVTLQLYNHIHDVLAGCARKNRWTHLPSTLQIDL
jgi:hypothetical protein